MGKRTPMGTGKKVIFGLLATVLFFGLAEVGFRVVVSLTSDRLSSMIGHYRTQFYSHINQELAYRPHPYFGYVRRDKGAKDAINRFGFWGSEWSMEKPPNTIRVVALGGSTTAGPLAWPHQLETVLNGRMSDGKAQVHNLGMGGWTSGEAVTAFAMLGLSLSPDFVVVHCVNNDMEPMRAIAPKVDYSHYRRAMDVVQTDEGLATYRQDMSDVVEAMVAQRSNLYVYSKLFEPGGVAARANLHSLTTWTTDTTAEPSAKGIAIFERNLRSIAALAEANGATMVLTTMPALAVARPGIPTVPDGHLRSLEAQNRRLRKLAEREDWLLVDLAKLTDELTHTYEDAIHVDVQGEQIKARAIADVLVQAGLVSPPPAVETLPTD